MSVGFASFEIARSGMTVNERALSVTGHNIANVNTAGYVRQQAIISSGPMQNENTYQLGLGADIEQIRQIRHQFLDSIYRRESTTLGYWKTRDKTFQDIQSILGDPMDSGLQEVMNQFWDSWQELSKEPDSLTVRALVAQRGEALVEQVNHVGSQLDKLQEDLNSEFSVRIDEVNSITGQIAKLNLEILKVEISEDTANDYRDQRNSLVDRLSELANVDVTEMQDGQLDITLGGYFLVSKGVQTNLVAEENENSGLFFVPKLAGKDIEVPIRSGILKGLMESRGQVFGAVGSEENGCPNTKADISFVVDVSDSSATNLTNVQSSIAQYIEDLKRRGIDYNLRLITYGSNVNSNVNYGGNTTAFQAAVASLTSTADTGNNFGDVVAELDGITDFRSGANKYAVVFSGESIDGDSGAGSVITTSSADAYATTLKNKGITTSVVTDTSYYSTGAAGETIGWNVISDGTLGKLYDINSADYEELMTNINDNINSDVNEGISVVKDSLNIMPDLRKRMNALINILAREVNYLHSSGKTLGNPPTNGEDFFVAINSAYPIGMGNIKLNDNLSSLNNIVASESGASGDNTIALAIANIRGTDCLQDLKGILSTDDYYQSIILSVGNGGSEAEGITESQQKLVDSANSQRQSIMGVSMDEEMSNMMKYKFAYSASSRAISIVDEMLDTIISRMGLAGR
ncbi:flagellar hook-associated protein FlgK [Acetivibrio cellulolyticus]|uniref:flagellar hook-associated protein FlgK n=1 Tax=Acetivibrio cellulolyticus TaxID=35830 RepID=UPI0001E30134|nr:flagellar hook-associated protein FlgK [Acetivibrio cellulolyticus]